MEAVAGPGQRARNWVDYIEHEKFQLKSIDELRLFRLHWSPTELHPEIEQDEETKAFPQDDETKEILVDPGDDPG